ncbi:unnamed protein product [Malus baccata var. baccata]
MGLASFPTPFTLSPCLIVASFNRAIVGLNSHIFILIHILSRVLIHPLKNSYLYYYHFLHMLLFDHSTPDVLFHFIHPACTLWLISLSNSPLFCKINSI